MINENCCIELKSTDESKAKCSKCTKTKLLSTKLYKQLAETI